jgi:TRAP transporter 4TM/12TM fusion protein
MAVYHLISSQYILTTVVRHTNIHLCFAFLLIFLITIKESKKIGKLLGFGLIGLTAVSIGYVIVFANELQLRAMWNTPLDLVIGVALIVLVFVGTYRAFGPLLVIISGIAVVYIFLGHHLPGFLHIMDMEPMRIIANLSIGLVGGIYQVLPMSANFIFLFILLGAVLQVSGATEFFTQVGRLAGRRLKAGPAMSAVVTSALVGTIMGSVGANIATTGSFTIPLMKKIGYKPEQAGAIEAAASSGGQIMPPVMGVAAFAMSGITGIPYVTIMLAAIIPALLYFMVLGLYVHFRAMGLDISRESESLDFKEMALRAPLFFVPLGAIVYFLMGGHSLMFCAFWAIISNMVLSLLRKQTRASLRDWVKGLTKGAIAGAQIAMAMACVGMLLRVLIVTGMAVRLPGAVEMWSGGSLVAALLIVMVISIILGMGMTSLAVYLILATVAAPVLLRMGLDILQAHFFVFFFACFSFVTPPIAPGAIIASKIAGARYIKTAIEAVKASLGGFVLPFLFILNPVLLLQPAGPIPIAIMRLTASLFLLVALEIVVVNQYINPLKLWERATFLLCAAVIIGYFATQSIIVFVAGLGIFIALTFNQIAEKKRMREATL